jgi:carbamoyltransferase
MSDSVLGISAHYHDSAAALVVDGQIRSAAQEERFTRRRHDAAFPAAAVQYCLDEAKMDLADIAAVAYYENPRLKFHRVLATYAAQAPVGFRLFRDTFPEWAGRKVRMTRLVRDQLAALDRGAVPQVVCLTHHESHAASAFYPSPYESAAVLCIDGVGEWATTTIWHGQAGSLSPVAQLRFPHSLGFLYSSFTYYCGFKVDSGEYKLMGLAPYGRPVYAPLIREHLIDVKADGSFRLNMRYFDFLQGEKMIGPAFERLLGGPRRMPEGPLTEREFDLAASVQQVTEEVVIALARTAQRMTGETKLCLAGGVALNCVANGRLVREGVFEEVWVQPAAGDAGGALGAALGVAARRGDVRRHLGTGHDAMQGSRLGPAFEDSEIQEFLCREQLPHAEVDEGELCQQVAAEIADGKVVGWFQGRMEFGPRALGARSILGDPRNPEMQSVMNLKIKFRESFRPFAPAVLAEHVEQYFQLKQDSPYMMLVAEVSEGIRLPAADTAGKWGLDLLKSPRSGLPAVTHVDYSARVQTVGPEAEPRYRALLEAFYERTGCAVLVNTSFNVRGEPIVCSPQEAYACFMRTNIDTLVLGTAVLHKADQPPWQESGDWRAEIPLD